MGCSYSRYANHCYDRIILSVFFSFCLNDIIWGQNCAWMLLLVYIKNVIPTNKICDVTFFLLWEDINDTIIILLLVGRNLWPCCLCSHFPDRGGGPGYGQQYKVSTGLVKGENNRRPWLWPTIQGWCRLDSGWDTQKALANGKHYKVITGKEIKNALTSVFSVRFVSCFFILVSLVKITNVELVWPVIFHC